MNDKKKNLWDNSLNNISEEHIEEMAQTLYKKSLTDFNENDLVIVETEKKSKLPIFALVASIVAIIGVAVITGVIISNSGILTMSSNSEGDSSIVSDDDTLTYNDFSYTEDNGTLTITRYNGSDSEVVIPEEINEKKGYKNR